MPYQIRRPIPARDSRSANAWPASYRSALWRSSSSPRTCWVDRFSAASASPVTTPGLAVSLSPYFAAVLVISAGAAVLLWFARLVSAPAVAGDW